MIEDCEAGTIDMIITKSISRFARNTLDCLKYIRQLPQEIDLFCHPLIDEYKEHNGLDISMPLKPAELPANFRVHRERKPVMISEHIMYLGEIERTIQKVRPLGNDYLYDDTAMVYVGRKGSFIITACSHSGIINIVEYVKKLKRLAARFGVVILLIAHPKKASKDSKGFENDDILGSSNITNFADIILRYDVPSKKEQDANNRILELTKGRRDGRKGKFAMFYDFKSKRISDSETKLKEGLLTPVEQVGFDVVEEIPF